MSQGLIDYLQAKKIHDETGQWPVNQPAFTEGQIKAVLEKIAKGKSA